MTQQYDETPERDMPEKDYGDECIRSLPAQAADKEVRSCFGKYDDCPCEDECNIGVYCEKYAESLRMQENISRAVNEEHNTAIRKKLISELRDHLNARKASFEKHYPVGHDQRDGAQARIAEIDQTLLALDAIESLRSTPTAQEEPR